MKAVALDAMLRRSRRAAEPVSATSRLAAVKARIETGDLRHVRQALGDRLDRRQIMGLMQRGEGRQADGARREPPA